MRCRAYLFDRQLLFAVEDSLLVGIQNQEKGITGRDQSADDFRQPHWPVVPITLGIDQQIMVITVKDDQGLASPLDGECSAGTR